MSILLIMCLLNYIYYLFNRTDDELKNINPENIKYFSFDHLVFNAKPCHIYDGDTFSVIFKYRNEYIKYKCRCNGYDSPEMKPLLSKPNRDDEIRLANLAKNRLTELLNKNELVTIKCHSFEKYGRILVTVYNNIDNDSINDIMIKENHGKSYHGGHKE